MYVFSEKLGLVKRNLTELSKKDGNISSQIKITRDQLCLVQGKILNGSTEMGIYDLERAYISSLGSS